MIEAQFAVITFLLHLREILSLDFRQVAFVFVEAIDERIERRTEVKAPAASIADIKDPDRFRFEFGAGPSGINKVEFSHRKKRMRQKRLLSYKIVGLSMT